MSDIAIHVENLSKLYRIGRAQQRHDTLRDLIVSTFQRPALSLSKGSNVQRSNDTIWALKDVSFEVERGEVVGIIGRNGAGKTTLLKILSRITKPTEGRAVVNGRVGSLLEVGTGFHPELTGRENIYLNGAILGMNKVEIDRKFEEIVAFAEIEKFLDTPVKRYSSGMYVRLAFSVAAHLEPEILLVDEVLAVGDAQFQKKCLGKMGDVAKEGRTVLFVSHSMPAINSLCQRAILIKLGKASFDGPTGEAIARYIDTEGNMALQPSRNVKDLPRVQGDGTIRICEISLRKKDRRLATSFAVWEPFIIEFVAQSREIPRVASFWVLMHRLDGTTVLGAFQYDSMEPVALQKASSLVQVHIEPNGLCPGVYTVSIGAFGRHNEFLDWVDHATRFEIRSEFWQGRAFDSRLGLFTLRFRWSIH